MKKLEDMVGHKTTREAKPAVPLISQLTEWNMCVVSGGGVLAADVRAS